MRKCRNWKHETFLGDFQTIGIRGNWLFRRVEEAAAANMYNFLGRKKAAKSTILICIDYEQNNKTDTKKSRAWLTLISYTSPFFVLHPKVNTPANNTMHSVWKCPRKVSLFDKLVISNSFNILKLIIPYSPNSFYDVLKLATPNFNIPKLTTPNSFNLFLKIKSSQHPTPPIF